MNVKINLKEIIRSAFRNKGITTLSISGMAIGIAIALLIGFWSLNEFSFDKYHKDSDRIYRVCRQGFINNESVFLGSDFGPVGTTAKEQFPEIEDVSRIRVMGREVVKIKGTTTYEDQICTVDKNLFNFFTFKLETGNQETCLDGTDKLVIDRYLSNKYFRGENPVGQMIEIYGKQFQVSAIMENIPENSHLKFHIAIPFESLNWLGEKEWGNNDCFITYLKVKPNTNTEALSKQISEMTYQHFPVYKQFKISHFLQPLRDIHFSPGFRFDYVITNDRRIVFIFISLAALILLIASFNFINLFISTSFLRAKSIGIKKINGSSKRSLFISSYTETTLYIVVATLLAACLSAIFLPSFNQLSGTNLKIDFSNYQIYLYTGILMFTTIVVAGTIPVLYILRFNPEEIIRNRFKGKGVTVLQRVLVISQFAASIILITSAGFIKKQINFVLDKDLGFNKEQVIYFSPKNLASNFESIREELMKNPNILEVSAKTCLPSEWNNGNPVTSVEDPGKEYMMEICQIKYNYPAILEIPVIKGSNPFHQGTNTTDECLINEQAATALDMTDPVGKEILITNNRRVTIAGVLKNANTKSLHLQVDPQVYLPLDKLEGYHIMMVKTSKNTESALKSLSTVWTKNNPEVPFEYSFLDDTYQKLYKTEQIASKIISIGMVLAMFLAFMGLFAIAHYATERRVKEIGIRRVNGALVGEILIILNKDFVKWVVISFVIATPIAYYAMNKWLENFAFKTEMSWWIFALAGLLALGIAMLTVSWQSWRAATRNPVEALRYE